MSKSETHISVPEPTIRSVVVGVWAYLPEKCLTNAELEKIVDTTDDWIVQRTGIHVRHIASENETTSMLATYAAKRALMAARLEPEDIDLIIVATSTPDRTFPATATQVQAALGNTTGVAFDIQAVCSGFVFALATADKFLTSGSHKRALVIGAETFSRLLDWSDRSTCVLFGDGAGALVLEARPKICPTHHPEDRGILMSHIRSDGAHGDKLCTTGGVSSTKTIGHIHMEGREVFRLAVGAIVDSVETIFNATGFFPEDVDWVVSHQANERIMDAAAEKLQIHQDKVVKTIGYHGNTSAASIPLALAVAVEDGRIKMNDLVMLEAMGAGFAWGAMLIRW